MLLSSSVITGIDASVHHNSEPSFVDYSVMTDSAVDTLEERIAALEVGAKYDATKQEVRKVEQEFLEKLKEIRLQVIAEQGQATNSAELTRLQEENARLKQQNEKLAYRVKHVVASLNTLLHEQKNKQSE